MQIQNQFYQCKPSWALPFFSFNKILITYPKKKKKKKKKQRKTRTPFVPYETRDSMAE
jgi:hypothetical protein